MAHSTKKALIIGGGIIGGLAAYYMRQKGWSVTIVEKDRFGHGASHGNCGLVAPGHANPLNSLENLIKGIGWMLKKDAPLFVRLHRDPAWIRWIIQFMRHCFGNRREVSAAGRSALITEAISMYAPLIETEGIDCDWDVSGSCHLFRCEKEFSTYENTHGSRKQSGSSLHLLTESDLRNMAPAVSPEVIGAWHDRRAAHLRPDLFMGELFRVLKNKGIEIVEQAGFIGLTREKGRALTARTTRGDFAAEAFVVATGAWTPLLSKTLGCRVPIQPGKGYSTTMRRPANVPALPCFFEEMRVVVTPWQDSLRLGGTLEFSGFDDTLNPLRLGTLFRALDRYMPLSLPDRVEVAWCGWRPMTWDGLPVIDRLPGCENVVVAAGHNELGITMAPATGRLVAEMINQEAPHIDPSPYRIERL